MVFLSMPSLVSALHASRKLARLAGSVLRLRCKEACVRVRVRYRVTLLREINNKQEW